MIGLFSQIPNDLLQLAREIYFTSSKVPNIRLIPARIQSLEHRTLSIPTLPNGSIYLKYLNASSSYCIPINDPNSKPPIDKLYLLNGDAIETNDGIILGIRSYNDNFAWQEGFLEIGKTQIRTKLEKPNISIGLESIVQ